MTIKKDWFNIILPIIGIIIIFMYINCNEACIYIEGFFWGLPLIYLGMIYMGSLIISNIFKKMGIFLLLLSFGLGAEFWLLRFQIQHGILCYYCLSYGAIVFILFLLNFKKSKKILISVFLLLGLFLFAFFFKGSITPVYADSIFMPSFGTGKIDIRLYTDYFCGPCKSLEPKIEPIIIELVENNVITITFIDTPIHPQTRLYAKYFLYILNENRDFRHALQARAVLFEAAGQKIKNREELEAFIKSREILYKPFDTKSTFDIFNKCFKEDKINATPTCVISDGGKKKFVGKNIISALKSLK